jgi:small subunit ribosomal protein S5
MDRNRRDDRRGPQGADQVEKQYDERVLAVDRVARVVKGGRRFRFRSLVIVGDKKGKVGIGIAKGADVTTATTKATEVAKKNIVVIPLYKGTIPHEVEGKVAGAKLMIKPAAPGTGLIAGATVRAVLEAVGVQNALSKSFGSSNKINACYATIEALKTLQPQKDWVTYKNAHKGDKKVVAEPAKAPEAKKAPVAAKAPSKKGDK